MKNWNKEGEPEAFSDLVDGLHDALNKALSMREGVYQHGLPYKGFEVGESSKLTNYSAEERFKAEQLRSEKEQGRDVFSVIISTAVHLGMEQGKRVYYQEIQDKLEMTKVMASGVYESIKQLEESGGSVEN